MAKIPDFSNEIKAHKPKDNVWRAVSFFSKHKMPLTKSAACLTDMYGGSFARNYRRLKWIEAYKLKRDEHSTRHEKEPYPIFTRKKSGKIQYSSLLLEKLGGMARDITGESTTYFFVTLGLAPEILFTAYCTVELSLSAIINLKRSGYLYDKNGIKATVRKVSGDITLVIEYKNQKTEIPVEQNPTVVTEAFLQQEVMNMSIRGAQSVDNGT